MTQHINTGGPAFPMVHGTANGDGTYSENQVTGGMSLRDWFAGKAMQGLLASSVKGSEDQFAEYSYKVADAMLRAREGVK